MINENKLVTVVNETGIELEKAKSIWVKFEPLFETITECAGEIDGLEITDISQMKEMELARKVRLKLKSARVSAGKIKDGLKESILKEGKFIDTTFRLISDATKPVEADLLEKEKFAERKERERIEKLANDRAVALQAYDVDTSMMTLGNMSQEVFDSILQNYKEKREQRIEEERRAEEERIEREKKEAEERERLVAENERLRREREAREREIEEQIAKERAEAEEARRRAEDAARREREARELLEKAERERQREELRIAQEEKARIERELDEKNRAEQAETERVEAQRKADESERVRLEQAGDQEKLLAYIEKLVSIECPVVDSDAAKEIMCSVNNALVKAIADANTLG